MKEAAELAQQQLQEAQRYAEELKQVCVGSHTHSGSEWHVYVKRASLLSIGHTCVYIYICIYV
jgi:hypothetical protein